MLDDRLACRLGSIRDPLMRLLDDLPERSAEPGDLCTGCCANCAIMARQA